MNAYELHTATTRERFHDLATAIATARSVALRGASVRVSGDDRSWWTVQRTPSGEWQLVHDHSAVPLFETTTNHTTIYTSANRGPAGPRPNESQATTSDCVAAATLPIWHRRALELLARLDTESASQHRTPTLELALP